MHADHWSCVQVQYVSIALGMFVCEVMYMYLLDISRQLACMKLGRREKYQRIQYCWAGCLGYPVHTCHLHIYVAVPRQDSMSAAGAHAVLSGHCNRFVGYL